MNVFYLVLLVIPIFLIAHIEDIFYLHYVIGIVLGFTIGRLSRLLISG